MTGFRGLAAAVDDTKAILDSCSLNIITRAYSATVAYLTFNFHQEKVGRNTKMKSRYARLQAVDRTRWGDS